MPPLPSPSRPLSPRRLALPIVASLGLHALGVGALLYLDLAPASPLRPARLTAHATDDDSVALTLLPPPPAPSLPVTPPPPPPPTPSPSAPAPPTEIEIAPPQAEPLPVPSPTRPERTFAPAVPTPLRSPPAPRTGTPAPAVPTEPRRVVFASVAAQRAARVVYVVDVSGAMASSLPFLMAELERSVAQLTPDQRFQVVLFRAPPEGSTARAVQTLTDSQALLEPTPQVRADLADLAARVQPEGRSDLIAGLRAALRLDPELVFLLTRNIRRSLGPSPDAVLSELDRLNPRRRSGQRPSVIKVIQFVEDDPTGLLQRLADVHGDGPGSYTVLAPESPAPDPANPATPPSDP